MSRNITSVSRAFTRCTRLTAAGKFLPRLLSTTATSSGSSTSPPPSASASSTAPDTPIPATTLLPYRIGRSNSLNLPVYHRIKSGGTNRTTEVKKIEGDALALSKRLSDELKLETKVNYRTNHVIIKGFHREKVVQWLTEKGL